MEKIEKLKFILGIILISFAILGGIIFFLESFSILNNILSESSLSMIYQNGISIAGERRLVGSAVGGGPSNVTIFLGLCGIAGAHLLASVKIN